MCESVDHNQYVGAACRGGSEDSGCELSTLATVLATQPANHTAKAHSQSKGGSFFLRIWFKETKYYKNIVDLYGKRNGFTFKLGASKSFSTQCVYVLPQPQVSFGATSRLFCCLRLLPALVRLCCALCYVACAGLRGSCQNRKSFARFQRC